MKLASKFFSVAVVALAAMLSGCGSSDRAAYLIKGASHSLSLIREKQFAWDGEWSVSLVTANNPECMRRHKLQPVPDGEFKVDLYRSLEGNYILKQCHNWYVTATQKCRLQMFQTPPREPGDPLGSYAIKDDMLQFVTASNPVTPSSPPDAPSPAAVPG